jgi:hypothetical protein
VPGDQVLPRRVPFSTLGPVRAATRRELTSIVAKYTGTPGLIESDPMLDFGEVGKADPGIVFKIELELFLVQKTEVTIMEGLGKVPMEECHEWLDVVRQ